MCISFDELPDEYKATVRAIFSEPPRSNIAWAEVSSLLINALNGEVYKTESFTHIVVKLSVNNKPLLQLPYPEPRGFVKPYMIQHLRSYLSVVGVEPN